MLQGEDNASPSVPEYHISLFPFFWVGPVHPGEAKESISYVHKLAFPFEHIVELFIAE